MTYTTLPLEAENLTKPNIIPPKVYASNANLSKFIDCIFRTLRCCAGAYVGWQPKGVEIRQILYLTKLLYTEIEDCRREQILSDRPNISPYELDRAMDTRFDRLLQRSHLQSVADRDVRDEWEYLLKNYLKENEEENE